MKKKLFFIFLAILFVVELFLRSQYFRELEYKIYPSDIYRFDPIINYSYCPNTEFGAGDKIISINKQGYIGEDFKVNDSTVYKKAIIGSSSVTGPTHILEYANFTQPLEEKLKERGYSIQIMNCGIDGADRSYLLYQSVRSHVLAFNPDMILFEYDLPLKQNNEIREPYNNYLLFYPKGDSIRLGEIQAKVDKLVKYNSFFSFLHKSYIVRALIRYKQNHFDYTSQFEYDLSSYRTKTMSGMWGVDIEEISMNESISLIKELQAELTEKKIDFFLFDFYGKINSEMANKNKLPLMHFNIKIEPEDFIYKDGHLNEKGCEKLADHVYTLLIKHQLIPEKYLLKSTTKVF